MGTHQIAFNYNTEGIELTMPEYGRNVQQLINVCKTINDDKERQAFAEAIIDLMQTITPYNRNYEEHRKKLWHHFFRIAKYNINVSPPPGLEISRESDIIVPDIIKYPSSIDRYRHYGAYVNNMIAKARSLDDEEKRKAFALIIAVYMKTAFRNWNREHFISDDSIKEDLANMSNGELKLGDDITLEVIQGTPRHLRHKNFKKDNKGNKYNRNNKFKKNKRG
jgi:hypothetical protein